MFEVRGRIADLLNFEDANECVEYSGNQMKNEEIVTNTDCTYLKHEKQSNTLSPPKKDDCRPFCKRRTVKNDALATFGIPSDAKLNNHSKSMIFSAVQQIIADSKRFTS